MRPAHVLVADIGGTHARFALARSGSAPALIQDSTVQLAVGDFASLVHAAQHYLRGAAPIAEPPREGVIAVAGRVEGDQALMTNHPWRISGADTAAALGFASLHLINDFTAQAMAASALTAGDLAVVGDVALAAAHDATRTYAVLGPGTGLGVSALLLREGRTFALETEGGHTGFAPTTPGEAAVLELLARDFGRVSNERLLSGGGLRNIHRALAHLGGDAQPRELQPHEITAAARAGDPLCARAIEFFCGVFGAVAGDLVLTLGAWDGVFLTGGLVPRLLAELRASPFRDRFEAKGRFSDAMRRVPTVAVLHPHAGLLGAAAFAFRERS